MQRDLDNRLHSKIVTLCKEGDEFAAKQQYRESLNSYATAWDLLPEPKLKWEAAMWIQTAIGDTRFLSGDYQRALQAFALAVQGPNGLGNPFIHLRLGECHFELGDVEQAKDELTRAYMGAGRDIFADENPKYFDLLKSILKPPIGRHEL
jgi:tetratricopeptide (TPR) repeat protein